MDYKLDLDVWIKSRRINKANLLVVFSGYGDVCHGSGDGFCRRPGK
jgi:hypothetical protein